MAIIYEKHKMKPREIFIYLMMSIMKDQTLMALDQTRRTAILDLLRKEYCPSVTDDDWASLAREVEFNKPEIDKSLRQLMKRDDLVKIYAQVQERFSKRN